MILPPQGVAPAFAGHLARHSRPPPFVVGIAILHSVLRTGPAFSSVAGSDPAVSRHRAGCAAAAAHAAAFLSGTFDAASSNAAPRPRALSRRNFEAFGLDGGRQTMTAPSSSEGDAGPSARSDRVAAPVPFGSYLSQTTESFNSRPALDAGSAARRRRIEVTMGNEAGDADSVVASLALSYARNLRDGGGGAGEEEEDPASVQVPLVSIPRADLPLRRETALLLALSSVDASDLLYLDDPSIERLLFDGGAADAADAGTEPELTLVDHNRVRPSLSHLSDAVVEILDHHADENEHRRVRGDRRVVAFENGHATVGSACTLVAEYLLNDDDERKIDRGVGLALLGVILLDTVNMSPDAGKGTPRDGTVIARLMERTDWSRSDGRSNGNVASAERVVFPNGKDMPPDRKALHDYLCDSKFDVDFWEGMSVWDCLRIDYKRFQPSSSSGSNSAGGDDAFGLSSVLLPLDSFLSKPDLVESVGRYMTEEAGVPLLGVLSMTISDGGPKREIVLFGLASEEEGGNAQILNDMVRYLLTHDEAKFLDLEEVSTEGKNGWAEGGNVNARRFRQGNVKGSRKQVAPVMLKFYDLPSSSL